jgi:hypothetical protein
MGGDQRQHPEQRHRVIASSVGMAPPTRAAGQQERRPMVTTIGWYAVLVGVLMVGWWTVEVRAGVLDRPDRTRAELGLHLTAELVTAALLVAGGAVLLSTGEPYVFVAGLGMLLYTAIQSPGYFLARGEREPVVMFAILVTATVVALASLLALT